MLSQALRGRAAAAALTRAHCSASLSLSCGGGGRLASASRARWSVWALSGLALRRAGEGARQQPRTVALCVRPRNSAWKWWITSAQLHQLMRGLRVQTSTSCSRTCRGMRAGRDRLRTRLSPLSLLLPPGCAFTEERASGGTSWINERSGKDQAALRLCIRHQRAPACTAVTMGVYECHMPSEETVCR